MVWIAAWYLTASPMPGSSSPICVFIVLQPVSPRAAAATNGRRGLKDMSVILFKTDGLLLGHPAGSRRRRRRGRPAKRPPRRPHTGIGPPVEPGAALGGRSDPISRKLYRAGRPRPHEPRDDGPDPRRHL